MGDRLMIGAMSGTSADGVDAALVRIAGSGLDMRATLVNSVECAFSTDLREHILRVRNEGKTALSDLADLGRTISLAYVDAIRQLLAKSGTKPEKVSAAAIHGQTLFHAPPLTIQWIDPALVSVETGIDVVADFRRADCAAGGQGAPLVPFADYILFKESPMGLHSVILNIGGIANITVLPRHGSIDTVLGFDTGPGNCISDWLMRENGGVDVDGTLALEGNTCDELATRFLNSEYILRPPPKSTDGPAMINAWRACLPKSISLKDQLATAARVVERCVTQAIDQVTDWVSALDYELIVVGGGSRNRAIMAELAKYHFLTASDTMGIPTQAREAMAFAILGAATLDRVPANVLSVTGAKRPVVLGAVYPHS